jgi:hypothetical protein
MKIYTENLVYVTQNRTSVLGASPKKTKKYEDTHINTTLTWRVEVLRKKAAYLLIAPSSGS